MTAAFGVLILKHMVAAAILGLVVGAISARKEDFSTQFLAAALGFVAGPTLIAALAFIALGIQFIFTA